ncbi:DnaB-like helicase N-terminal domain-containing protein [Streptomyces microflavus]|uniref:DnaB-like helicase N-terminal domain-containing protein n=1 Tax=Streptomyces microflavus TaxID=1919 RepID=UPI003F4B7ECD
MSVLGAMLLGKDAIADILDCPMQPRDYHRPTRETIHTAILALYVNGEPADPITVAAELAERGELTKAGGAPYLHTLVQAVLTAANATYYADIVHEQAVLRSLTTAGGRIAQLGVSGEGGLRNPLSRRGGAPGRAQGLGADLRLRTRGHRRPGVLGQPGDLDAQRRRRGAYRRADRPGGPARVLPLRRGEPGR